MVQRRPDPNREARSFKRGKSYVWKPRLEVDELSDGMEARAVHGIAGGVQAFVEDAGDNLHDRAARRVPPAAPIATASPSASSPIVGDIMLAIRSPGASSPTRRSASPSMLFR